MRKVILFMHVSLDGYVCGPNNEQDWMTRTDDVMGNYLISDLLTTVDTMLLGRELYEGFKMFWPTVPQNAASFPKEIVDFAHRVEDSPKVVFSKTLKSVDWKNSTLATSDIATEVARLKQQPGGDMVVFGGASIAEEFTRLNLVDEYRLKLEPIVLGTGKPLFNHNGKIKDRTHLKLTNSRAFDSGVVGLYYEVIRS